LEIGWILLTHQVNWHLSKIQTIFISHFSFQNFRRNMTEIMSNRRKPPLKQTNHFKILIFFIYIYVPSIEFFWMFVNHVKQLWMYLNVYWWNKIVWKKPLFSAFWNNHVAFENDLDKFRLIPDQNCTTADMSSNLCHGSS